MTAIRLIVDPPQSGDWNMAVDEALLHSAAAGMTTLRFYEWSAPTLSLGYFQEYRQREEHAASRECACVRRSSGGGAILHDHELTYSFTTPINGQKAPRADEIYAIFHQTLIQVLTNWGLQARLSEQPQDPQGKTPPFLCFRRRAAGDVLLANAKICGSAQRRHRGALLQHGSLILKRSAFAPEIAGIEEIAGAEQPRRELVAGWCSALGQTLGAEWAPGELSAAELGLAAEIRQCRFANRVWNARR